jgi:branched-chain amino acid transport system permease protein
MNNQVIILGALVVATIISALVAPLSFITDALALGSVVATAFFRQVPLNLKSGALGILTLILIILLRIHSNSNFAFMGVMGVLLTAVILPLPRWIKGALGVAVLLLGIPAAGFGNTAIFNLGIQIGIFAALALGLNVVVGMAGLLDLGFAAFFAIGAYTWGIFGSDQAAKFITGFNPTGLDGNYFYLFMFIAVITTAITGVIIGLPALRLKGDYLAVVTLGLGEVVRVLANNLDHPINFTNGPQGISPVSRPHVEWIQSLFGWLEPIINRPIDLPMAYNIFFYLLSLLIIGVVVLVNIRLGNSRFGRAWIAIREDETAAKAMGIPLLPTKLIAFATGAAFSGVMGAVFAAKQQFVNPESFTLNASILILSMVILGGSGSIVGSVLGATLVTYLTYDLLKDFADYLNNLRQTGATILGYNIANLPTQLDPAKYERLVFGVILILMMIFRPEGLIPEQRHVAEAQKEENA